MIEVTCLRVIEVVLDCPHCNSVQDGFIGNPQGLVFECTECGKEYKVHPEAEPEIIPNA